MRYLVSTMLILAILSISCRHTSHSTSLKSENDTVMEEIDRVKFSRDNIECSFLCYLLRDKRIDVQLDKKCSIEFQIDGPQARATVTNESGHTWGTIAKIIRAEDGSTAHWLGERLNTPLNVTYLPDVNQVLIQGEESLVLRHPSEDSSPYTFSENPANKAYLYCEAPKENESAPTGAQYVVQIESEETPENTKVSLYKLTINYGNIADDDRGWEKLTTVTKSGITGSFKYTDDEISFAHKLAKLNWEPLQQSNLNLWNKGWFVHRGHNLELKTKADGSYNGTYKDSALLDVKPGHKGARPSLTRPVSDTFTCRKSSADQINAIAPKSVPTN